MIRSLFPVPVLLAASLALVACGEVSRLVEPAPEATTQLAAPGEGPPDARPGACYGKETTPAVFETVTEQVPVQPAQIASDGTVIHPAVYRTSTRQIILRERHETFFEVPCPDVLTPVFLASVQRALKARNAYHGPITATMDARTRRAIRAYQLPGGIDTDLLTLETARRLGLVAYAPEGPTARE